MKTVIEMAIEAGITPKQMAQKAWITQWCAVKELEAFAEPVRADEREACVKICDVFQARDVGMQPAECAGAIRARGNT